MTNHVSVSRRSLIVGLAGSFGATGVSADLSGADPQPKAKDVGGPVLHSLHASVGADGAYTLPALPYPADALEPSIDAETMRLHHGKHHAGYVKGANDTLARLADFRSGKLDAGALSDLSEKLAFNLSGHLLHATFWAVMGPKSGGEPTGGLAADLTRDFGNVSAFRAQFSAAATQVQGNGWGMLAWEPFSRRLLVLQVRNHQINAVWNVIPLLVLDVWEHAYYLKYQNVRADYVKAFWDVVNWSAIEQWYAFVKRTHGTS